MDIKKRLKPAINTIKTVPLIVSTLSFFILLKNILLESGVLNSFLLLPAWFSTLLFTLAGSIFAGNPVNSYILSGYFYSQGVPLIALTSFIIAWVTVGLAQMPVEQEYFGWKFVIVRNLISFVLSILAASLIVILYLIL